MISISSFMSSSIQRDVHILDDGQQNILQGVTTLWLTHFRPNMLNSGPKAEDGETQAFRAGVHCTRPRNNPANNLLQKTDVVVFTVWFLKKNEIEDANYYVWAQLPVHPTAHSLC